MMIKTNDKDQPLLKVRNVKKFFNTPGGVVKAIDDVSFDVNQGQIIGLIGESGSGKTTVGRCLIRLYNQYSGSVSFNNEIISGDKLTKQQKRFLNKNIQMIFQDPHASLNSQHNVYSILKEPLLVNKIMKEEYKDFFSDWQDVCQNFRYSFREEAKKMEMEIAIFHTKEAKLYLKEWTNILNNIEFKYEDIENDFNQYFSFLLSDQQHESNVISKMFDSNSNLLKYYFKSQQEYRQGNILFVEEELKAAKQYLKKVTELSTKSQFLIDKEQDIKKLKQLIKSEVINFGEYRKGMISVINSYLKEFENDYRSNLDNAHLTKDIEKFNKHIKLYYVYKKMHSLLKSSKNKLAFLNEVELEDLITKIKQVKDNFLIELDKRFDQKSLDYKKQVSEFVANNFKLSFEEEIASSNEKEKRWIDIIKTHKVNVNTLKREIKLNNEKPCKTYADIIDAQNKYEIIDRQNESEIQKFLVGFNQRMNEYNNRIKIEQQQLENVRLELAKINETFNEKHKEFINGLLNFLLSKKEKPRKIKSVINLYENKIKQKKEALKAFKFEVTNLKNDFRKLKHLLGIEKNSISNIYVKKILIKERIYKALEEVGLLRQFAWRYPHEFSGGQRQRIVIARALISNPKLIIADEPIASLDVSIQAQVVNLLKELCEKKNISLIFIAHDLSMVEYIADYVLIMHLGKIVEAGETNEIYSNPLHPYTKNLFESIPKISNANVKFEEGNFENEYLKEQADENLYVDYFEVNSNHDLYCSLEQFKKWTKNKQPKISKFTKHVNTFKQQIKSSK